MSTNAKGNKVIPYKIKEAEIKDAVICDIKTVCKKKRGQELPNTTHPEPLAPITENPYKVVEFYNRWRKVIPEQFRDVACPEPTPEQYAAVKLEAGIRSGVKNLKGTRRLVSYRRWRRRHWRVWLKKGTVRRVRRAEQKVLALRMNQPTSLKFGRQ
jgi:hypothetical protein